MVAYSYQPQFIDPTLSGRKIHTVRAEGRRRHGRAGDELQHFVGMRTKHCRKFARSTCLETLPIALYLERPYLVRIGNEILIQTSDKLNSFAQCDGFEDWLALVEFWDTWHPGRASFTGVIVYWKDVQPCS